MSRPDPADDGVVAALPVEVVGVGPARDPIAAVTGVDLVLAVHAQDGVVAAAGDDRVVAFAADQGDVDVGACGDVDGVVPPPARITKPWPSGTR